MSNVGFALLHRTNICLCPLHHYACVAFLLFCLSTIVSFFPSAMIKTHFFPLVAWVTYVCVGGAINTGVGPIWVRGVFVLVI